MHLRRVLSLSLPAVLAAGLWSGPSAAQDMADAKLLASNCFNCHGFLGRSAGVIDGLDSLPARRIAEKLREFKSGEKPATIMGRIAKGYEDPEIEAIAAFIEKANTR